jgi:predicted nucleotidyltransferase
MQADPTPDAAINLLLEQLLSEVQKIFGKKLIGFYLFGSLVTGDFERGSSDIDLVAVTASDIDEQELEELQQMHRDFVDKKNKEWDDRIEVAYLSVTALKTFKVRHSKMAIISPGEPFHVKEVGKDWLMNWYTVREKGLVLFGPSPKTLIDPISQEEFVHAVQEYAKLWIGRLPHLPKRRPAQAYAILTMCRALYTSQKGEQVSKKRAALWAEKEFPQWASLIQNALVWREAWRDEQVDHEAPLSETQQFVRFVISQFENTSGTSKTDSLP